VGALVWLLIPAVAALCAAVWARWATRRRVTRDGASLAGYERFRAAMESVPDTSGRSAPAGSAEDAPEDGERAASRDPGERESEVPAAAPAGRRRRIIHAGHGAKRAHTSRTASAQSASEGGGEDSPKGPVAGSVP